MSKGIGKYFLLLTGIFCISVFLYGQSPDEQNLTNVVKALNGIPFERRSLLADYGGFGASILVRSKNKNDTLQGEPAGTFVLAVPLYAGFAVDTALALVQKLKDREMPLNIIVAFLGDEMNKLPPDQGGISHKGLRDLLTLTDMPENWVLCYMDAQEPAEEMVIRHGIRGYVAPLEIIKPLPSLFNARLIPWTFGILHNEIYKLGLVEGPEVLTISWGEEVNGFVLSGKSPSRMTGAKTISPVDLADFFLDYALDLSFPILNADRHYSSIIVPGRNIVFLSEGITVILLLATTGFLLLLLLLYSAKYNTALFFHIRHFFKYFWIFAILPLLLVLSIKVSGLIYSRLLHFLGAPSAAAGYAGVILVLLFSLLIFFLPSPLLDMVRFPRRAQFYGLSAVIIVFIGMFFAAFLDFSYVPVFLWTFFFVFLGAFFSNPVPAFLCIIIAPLFSLSALFDIINSGSNTIVQLFFSLPWNRRGNWMAAIQIALIALPLFLLVKREIIILQKRAHRGRESKPNRKYRLIIIPASILLVFVVMVLQVLLIPKGGTGAERRYIVEENSTGKTENEILRLAMDNVIFQNSKIITLTLGARGRPIRFDISLESANGSSLLPVYSAPVPFEREEAGKKINFSLGEYAPNPLTMEIVVPVNFDGKLKTEAVYNTWDPEIDRKRKTSSNDYILRVSQTIDLHPTS